MASCSIRVGERGGLFSFGFADIFLLLFHRLLQHLMTPLAFSSASRYGSASFGGGVDGSSQAASNSRVVSRMYFMLTSD
ncbi:MAG: hypothetical protein A2Z94_05390 [Gallionellales bacterium GWA2_55_18]|nr:MAG: hypothetical protein A2Z94_05390 [Gallionellales bacterium GWA2_55_18]